MRYRVGDYVVDTDAIEIRRGDEVVAVEPQVFDVVVFLIRERHRVVTKNELLDAVWGNRFVTESALTSRIRAARLALGDDGRTQSVIRTTHGKGYRFVATVIEQGGRSDAETPVQPPAVQERLTRRPTVQYTESRGHGVAYSVLGDGPRNLVFINGFCANLDIAWESPNIAEFYERLSSFSRLVVYDKVGTGVSDRLGRGQVDTLEDRMTDLLAVMDAAEMDRATIFGVSEGGPLSVLLAASHPDRVERMVIFGSFVDPPRVPPVDLSAIWGTGAVFAYLAGLEIDAPEMDALVRGEPADEQLAFYARWERLSCNPMRANELVAMTRDCRVEDILPAVRVPIKIIHRRGDRIAPIDQAERLVEAMPAAELAVVPGDEHLWFAGDPTAILDHVQEFVTGSAPEIPVDRILATVLFVDIVESTAMAGELGDRRWTSLLEQFYTEASTAVAASGGDHVNTTGDGILASFMGPARAVRCAADIRDRAKRLDLDVRAGVHTAEIERRGDDLAGIGVHIGARVAGAAGPGEVLVSRTVKDLVFGSGLEFTDRGEHELKGVSEPWPLFAAQV